MALYPVVAPSPPLFLTTDQMIISENNALNSSGRQKTLTHD